MNIELIFTKEEINKNIPYNMICETRYGSVWNTMKRRLLWNNEFTKEEKENAEKMFRQTHTWYTKGVTESVRMDFSTYRLWNKVTEFCCCLIGGF